MAVMNGRVISVVGWGHFLFSDKSGSVGYRTPIWVALGLLERDLCGQGWPAGDFAAMANFQKAIFK